MDRKFKTMLETEREKKDLVLDQEQMLELSKRILQEAMLRGQKERINFGSFLIRQIRFLGWKVWGMQTGMLLVMLLLFRCIAGFYTEDYIRYIPYFVCGISFGTVISAIPLMQQSSRYRMHEIEASARFSAARLLGAKLMVIGAGDFAILTGIILFLRYRELMSTEHLCMYVIFPFLLAAYIFLLLLGRIPAQQFSFWCTGACLAALMLLLLAEKNAQGIYNESYTFLWGVACVLLTALCIRQLLMLLHGRYNQIQLV